MQDFFYSSIGVTALFIQLIINGPLMFQKGKKDNVSRYYCAMMLSMFAYYITDACWGLFAGLKWTTVLFVDTTVYYIAMGAIVVFWYCYIVEYLNYRGRIERFFKWAGVLFLVLEVSALLINCLPGVHVFFYFNEKGDYVALPVRYAAFAVQAVMCVVSDVVAIRGVRRSTGRERNRNVAIFGFSLIMLAAILAQIVWPLLPIYAFGCIVGSCLLHVYVLEDERDELRQLLAREKEYAESANSAKSTFLFNMSHDIRTPMNAILGFTDIAEKHMEEPERVRTSLGKIKSSGEHLLSLINDVLDMSRIESGTIKISPEALCIDTTQDHLYSMMNGTAEAKNIRFICELDPSIVHHWIYADRLLSVRVFTNVISNSIKYTNPGGEIRLLTEELPCEKEGYARYRITLSDTGIGMSPEFLAHVFEPFTRAESSTKSGVVGTGLGMAITKSLVELMGGTITIESELGVGTTIRIEYENEIAEPVRLQDEQLETVSLNLAGKKILLVEDNELNREIATEILEEEGMTVDTAEDGDIAVEKLRTAAEGQYDLVLMDIQMPRMNGYEATKAIRDLDNPATRGIPIIAMTANAFDEDKKNAFDAGMNGHLSKPIDIPKLMKTLSEILG